jgi:hypothetical protein
MRSFSALLPAMVALIMLGAAPSHASDISEAAIGPPHSPAPPTADAIKYAPQPATSSPRETYRVAGRPEPFPRESTLSEGTIQPGPYAPEPAAREALATGGSQPNGGVKLGAKIPLLKKVEQYLRH